MPSPDFYYTESCSQKRYVQNPAGSSGILDLERLQRGQPAWEDHQPLRVLKQKKIILTDFTACTWSYKKIRRVCNALTDLIEKGFEIYVWQQDEAKQDRVLPLQKRHLMHLHDTHSKLNISLASHSTVTDAAIKQHKFSKESIFILDDYEIEKLLHPTQDIVRVIPATALRTEFFAWHIVPKLYVTEQKKLNQLQVRQQAVETLNSFTQPFQRITFDAAQEKKLDEEALHASFPSLLIVKVYPEVWIQDDSWTKVRLAPFKDAETLHITANLMLNRALDIPTSFPNIDEIELLDATKNFHQLLCTIPKTVRSLHIACNVEEVIYQNNVAILPNLETVIIGGSSYSPPIAISPNILETILHAAPNIKMLRIQNNGDYRRDLFEKFSFTNKLSQLKNLELLDINCAYNDQCIGELLESSPNLRVITLPVATDALYKLPHPEKLEELTLNYTVGTNSLKKILSKFPNLKKLNCCYSSPRMLEDIPSPLNLEELCLDFSKIFQQELEILIAAAPNLKKLSITACNCIDKGTLPDAIRAIIVEHPQLHTSSASSTNTESASASPSTQTVNPDFNSEHMQSYIPASAEHKVFRYLGNNNTKNQKMITEKLCQYLTITQQHTGSIKKIMDGICGALARHFINKQNTKNWDKFLDSIVNWHGQRETLSDELVSEFITLYEIYNATYHDNNRESNYHYLGDNLALFLDNNTKPCILSNAVHTIAIYPVGKNNWLVYDPNYTQGAQEVSQQELLHTIHRSIGHVVAAKTPSCQIAPLIIDAAQFLYEGGLLILLYNPKLCDEWLQIIKQHKPINKTLKGLLFRDIKGVPAWISCLKNPKLSGYIATLLQEFIKTYPKDYYALLQKSIELLTPAEQHEAITSIVQYFPESSNKNKMLDVVRNTTANIHYENCLATWYKPLENISSHLIYSQLICTGLIKKRLIECQSTQQIQALRFALESFCTNQPTHHPVFYIHSPDELVCAASYIMRKGQEGYVHKGPGGPLYYFLHSKREDGCIPILLVNYENFHAEDIVRLNTLLDKQRNVDGILLSEQTVVVGLTNSNNLASYKGADFYSRFDTVETCPLETDLLKTAMPVLTIGQENNSDCIKIITINLFHSLNWKQQLCGHWVLKGEHLVFQEGELAAALAPGKPIEIQNGLWQDTEFQRFWYEIARDSPNLYIIKNDGYNWEELADVCDTSEQTYTSMEVLNPQTISSFFRQIICNNEQHTLNCDLPGFIELAATTPSKTLSIFVSHTISEDDWAKLLTLCQQHQVTLQISVAFQVQLPDVLKNKHFRQIYYPINSAVFTCHLDDVDLAVLELSQQQKNPIIIDVSDLSAADLLTYTIGNFDQQTNRYFFEEQKHALLLELEKGNHVILKGHFSQELAALLLPKLSTALAKNITVISDDPLAFPVQSQEYHTTLAFKRSCLGDMDPKIATHLKPYLEREPLCHLKARRDFMLAHPNATSSDDAWQGYRHLDVSMPQEDDALTTQEYLAKRKQQLRNTLKYSPYVFITGLTGVGKSTFIENHFCTESDQLFIGDNKLLDFVSAKPQENGDIFLFLDEATLSLNQFNDFEGLFSTPKRIMVRGISYPLTDKHKVIFAGNPISYGDERHLAPFFEKHGGAEVFYPMPLRVIRELVLDPIISKLIASDDEKDMICKYLLERYKSCCALSKREVLMSPRELKTIALLVLSAQQRNLTINLLEVTAQITDNIINSLLPLDKRTSLNIRLLSKLAEESEVRGEAEHRTAVYVEVHEDSSTASTKQFASSVEFRKKSIQSLSDSPLKDDLQVDSAHKFVLTPSRKAIAKQINDMLVLRTLCITTPDVNLLGCMGGIILEGEPGVGKSELVLTLLRANNFEEQDCTDLTKTIKTERPFYRMPVSFSLAQKEALLIKAFHAGAVVIIDEINSSPMMEALLNDLLMGKAPGNIAPQKPGFLVIGTQNPITLAGRRNSSAALSRRLLHIDIPLYSREEMMMILHSKGLSDTKATALIDAYQKQVTHAKIHHLSPAPTFRDLERLADEVLAYAHKEPSPLCLQEKNSTMGVSLFKSRSLSTTPKPQDNPQSNEPPPSSSQPL